MGGCDCCVGGMLVVADQPLGIPPLRNLTVVVVQGRRDGVILGQCFSVGQMQGECTPCQREPQSNEKCCEVGPAELVQRFLPRKTPRVRRVAVIFCLKHPMDWSSGPAPTQTFNGEKA
jgi:hypothetical protein